jgi:alkylation response protein AidB-like acyl-CoA dehydrogenase
MTTAKETEYQLLEDTARTFAVRELAPNREVYDAYPFSPFWDEALSRAYEVGLFHTLLPEDLGGFGRRIAPLCLLLRTLAETDASLAGIIFTHSLALEVLFAAGGEEALRQALEGRATAREALIACPAFVNPGEIELQAEARREGDAYRLYGKQDYLVLGNVAERAMIPAKVAGRPGYSFFLADSSGAGAAATPPVFSLGLHACPAVDLRLDGVRASLTGKEGEGGAYFATAAVRMTAAVAAIAAGIMAGSLDEALRYARQRSQGGTEIINWPEVRMILANMAVDAKIAEMATAMAGEAADGGRDGWQLCCQAAAIHATELAARVTTDGIQVLGGFGYLKDFGQEKRFRDAQQVQALLGLAPMKKMDYIAALIHGGKVS